MAPKEHLPPADSSAAATVTLPPSLTLPRRRSRKAVVPPTEGGGGDQRPSATHTASVPAAADLDTTIASIVYHHRERQDFLGAKVKIELQVKAIQRREHSKTCDRATHATCPGVYETPSVTADILRDGPLAEMKRHVKAREKAMLDAAKGLPLLDLVDSIRGLGRLSYAQIIAEAGDLAHYSNPAKLWQRMGMGQGPEGETRYEGRSPRRAAIMAVIGDNFVKAGGPYRELYDERKAYEQTKPACLKAFAKAGGVCKDKDAECCRPSHVHNRTRRWVVKRLLRELWRAWRAPRVEVHGLEAVIHRRDAGSLAEMLGEARA